MTNEKIVSSIIDYNKSTYEFGEIVEDQDISVFSNVRLNINKKNWELIQIIEGNVIFNIPDFIKLSDNGLTVLIDNLCIKFFSECSTWASCHNGFLLSFITSYQTKLIIAI